MKKKSKKITKAPAQKPTEAWHIWGDGKSADEHSLDVEKIRGKSGEKREQEE